VRAIGCSTFAEWILGKARPWIFLRNACGLAESDPNTRAGLTFSKHTGLSRERLWSPVGNAVAKPRYVSLGSAWIEMLVAAAGTDDRFEPA
jgi:hypothetical protein